MKYQNINVKILTGEHKGEILSAQNSIDESMAYNIYVDEGDTIFLFLEKDEMDEITNAYVSGIVREKYLLWLLIAFCLSLLIVGGLRGIKAIITLTITALAVVKILLPLLLEGYDPILVSVLTCAAVIIITLLILCGFKRKTYSAIIGTLGGVVIAGIIALIIGYLAKLTGLGNEEARMLMFIPQEIPFNFKGLLFAGIIIGSLGAVMDVSMSIASAMHEIEVNNPQIETKNLIKSGINVGRDIMGTMSNTLILAYAGGSLHLMLLFIAYNYTFTEIINLDMIATEIIRALAGSIGLILTIPLTALVSGTFRKN
jgi:uncharacterized membrane protein